MEWLAIILWGLVAGLAAPIGGGALMGAPSLGIAPLCGIGGLVCTLLFMIFGGEAWAWIAFGLAVAGAASVWLGAWRLVDETRPATWASGTSDETIALLCGAAGPLFLVEAGVALLVALNYSTVT